MAGRTGELCKQDRKRREETKLPKVTPGEPNTPPGQPHGHKMRRRIVSSLPVMPLWASSPFFQPRTLSQGAHTGAPCLYISAHLQNRPPWPPTLGSPPPSVCISSVVCSRIWLQWDEWDAASMCLPLMSQAIQGCEGISAPQGCPGMQLPVTWEVALSSMSQST